MNKIYYREQDDDLIVFHGRSAYYESYEYEDALGEWSSDWTPRHLVHDYTLIGILEQFDE